MTDEPDKRPGGGEKPEGDDGGEPDKDRSTVAPPFDPIAFAKEVLGSDPPPKAAKPTTPAAPKKSAGIDAPRPPRPTLSDPGEVEDAGPASGAETRRPGPTRRATPHGALSFADLQAPTVPPKSKEGTGAVSPGEREWDELATSPPPPMQQALIDSLVDAPPSARNAPSLADETSAAERRGKADTDDGPAIESLGSEQEMHDRVSLGDYTGALDIAEKLLVLDPDNQDAKECAESCRSVLKQMYTARIGALDRVPMVMVPRDQLRWLSIDHRAGFVLSLIDGVSSLEMILDVTGMPELDALRILSELVQQRIVSFR